MNKKQLTEYTQALVDETELPKDLEEELQTSYRILSAYINGLQRECLQIQPPDDIKGIPEQWHKDVALLAVSEKSENERAEKYARKELHHDLGLLLNYFNE